jgi:hypothetical protein
LKHLKSLHTFVLADFEQQFNPVLAITCPEHRERHPLPPSVEQNLTEKNQKVNHSSDNG